MTIEARIFVRIPQTVCDKVIELVNKAKAALFRAEKLPLGDQTEAVRFEALHAAIDQISVIAISSGASYHVDNTEPEELTPGICVFGPTMTGDKKLPNQVKSWVEGGSIVVGICLPHFSGETRIEGKAGIGSPEPAERWRTRRVGMAAVREKFEYLMAKAVDGGRDGVILPSGITNSVLTECLRRYAQYNSGQARIDVSVRYRDGSEGPRFPLRALELTESIPSGWKTYRFALLSIRHMKMDVEVDGAWLRNVKISQKRKAGFTDQIVFETSLRQFRRIASDGPVIIEIFQTGLETTIVGFYRALVEHLLERPGTIAVIPQYYQKYSRNKHPYVEGTTWATT